MKMLNASICGLMIAAGCSSQSRPAVTDAPPAAIYVDGEFNHHGKFAWTNGMRLQDAMDAAGVLTDFAHNKLRVNHWGGSVEIFRLAPHHQLTNNPLLRPGDRIYSPRT
jgi:protein involved in polysaccharide export with SLBB domain